MKLLVYYIILFIPFSVFAQIPNGEFENWTMVYKSDFGDYVEEPENWRTNNSPGCIAVSKTNDSFSGNFALNVTNNAFGLEGPLPGSAISTFTSSYTGNTISAYVKCDSISGTGSGSISIFGISGPRQTLQRIGGWATDSVISEYILIEIEVRPFVNYDSIEIYIIGYAGMNVLGSPTGYASLKVDGLFEGTITGIRQSLSNKYIEIYPNPCSSELNIKSDKRLNEILIFDINGKIVLIEKNIISSNTVINVSDFQSGVYFIQTINYKGYSEINKLIIN